MCAFFIKIGRLGVLVVVFCAAPYMCVPDVVRLLERFFRVVRRIT